MALTWFRFHSDALDNPRLQKLDPDLFRIWVNLQCILAQEKNSTTGRLPDITEISFRLRMPIDLAVEKLDLLVDNGLISFKSETVGNGNGHENRTDGNGNGAQKSLAFGETKRIYFLKNWEKKQYKSDTSTERTKRFRERHRNAAGTPPDQIRSDTDQIRSEDAGFLSVEKEKRIRRERNYSGNYDILIHITDDELNECRAIAYGWDIYHLAKQFNQAIASGRMMEPKLPHVAFKAWIPAFTKGKTP